MNTKNLDVYMLNNTYSCSKTVNTSTACDNNVQTDDKHETECAICYEIMIFSADVQIEASSDYTYEDSFDNNLDTAQTTTPQRVLRSNTRRLQANAEENETPGAKVRVASVEPLVRCANCRNCVHKDCMSRWLQTADMCVYCRDVWGSNHPNYYPSKSPSDLEKCWDWIGRSCCYSCVVAILGQIIIAIFLSTFHMLEGGTIGQPLPARNE
jgi:hypothetical protein